MATTAELKVIVEALARPPFNRTMSLVQLHDELQPFQLVQLLNDVLVQVDSQPNSIHKVDLRQELPEDTVMRISEYLRLLKYKADMDWETFRQKLLEGERPVFLNALHFLLKDINSLKKRAYLIPYLTPVDIPVEFLQDETVLELSGQYRMMQEQFKEIHRTVEQLRTSGYSTVEIKKEISAMEEEKQQVLSKITRLRKKVEEVPNHEQWLEQAKNLRKEQELESDLQERLKEQKNQLLHTEQKLANLQQKLKDSKNAAAASGGDAILQRMKDEAKMNRFLASENLPKMIEEKKKYIEGLQKVLSVPAFSERDINALAEEVKSLNETISRLTEKKTIKNNPIDDKLSLFRQQAAIISRKKEASAEKLKDLLDEKQRLAEELEKKASAAKGAGNRVLKGEEFKKYVADLRNKSNVYKKKKAEISDLTAEYGVLQRTEEILRSKDENIQEFLAELEKKKGISGFHVAQETLEKVSGKKEEVDEAKGKTLQEISDIVNKLVTTIQKKKNQLSPIIKDLRALRAKTQETETTYLEKKKAYEATMLGLESENTKLEQEVRTLSEEIATEESRYHYLNNMIRLVDFQLEKVMTEMKAYIGGDEHVEAQQKQRGFKSYREIYNKKIVELENHGKVLKEKQKEVKATHEPNLKQLAMFNDVLKLLALKSDFNARLIRGEVTNNDAFQGVMTQDRLVL